MLLAYCLTLLLGLSVATLEVAQCSRALSRQTAAAIQHTVFESLQAAGLSEAVFNSDCPFLPRNNVFEDQESHTYFEVALRIFCRICGKSFRHIVFIDHHFAQRHVD
jgi:hypothetical protein